MSKFYYLEVSLDLPSNSDLTVNAVSFKNLIVSSIKSLFGDFGASFNVDLLKYNEDTRRGIIRCLAQEYVKVRGSLAFCGHLDGTPCRFFVHQSSSLLLSLLGNSRTYIHCW